MATKKIIFSVALFSIAIIFLGSLSFSRDHSYAIQSGGIADVTQNQKYNGTISYITIRFDDTDSNQVQALQNVTKLHLPGDWNVNPALVGNPGTPTWEQITDLYNSGIEIGSHSETHYVVNDTTPLAILQYQIVQSKIDLQNKGFKIFGYVSPNDVITTTSSTLINENYYYTTIGPNNKQNTVFSIVNDGKPLFTIPVLRSNAVPGNQFTLDTFDKVKTQIDSSIANKTWAILLFHRINDTVGPYQISPHLFWQILQYVKQQSDLGKIKVVSPAQGLGLMEMRPTSTTVSPDLLHNKRQHTFQVRVADTNDGTRIMPTGTVAWNDGGAGGKFSPSSSCMLTRSKSIGVCSVSYTAPAISGKIIIMAIYSGDDIHRPSIGTATIVLR